MEANKGYGMSEKIKSKYGSNKRGYSTTEVAQMFGIGKSTVFEQIYKGNLDAYKIGSRTIIPFEALEEWEKNNRLRCKGVS